MIDGRPAPDPRAEKWALRILGLKGFARGIRPTVLSSFVGSAATISECCCGSDGAALSER